MQTETPATPAELGRGLYLYVVEDDAAGLAQHVDTAGPEYLDEALAWAVDLRKEGMVQTLLEAGGYVDTPRLSHINHFRDNTAYGDAYTHDENVWTYFTFENPCDRIIHTAYENRDIGIMISLLKAGAYLYGEYHNGELWDGYPTNIFLDAIKNDDMEMMQLFCDHGENVCARSNIQNDRWWTPLMWACNGESLKMVRFIADCGPVDKQGGELGYYTSKMTCLHVCIEVGNREALRVLMERGVDITVYDGRGISVLTSAIEQFLNYMKYMFDIDDKDPYWDDYDYYENDPDEEFDEELKARRLIISDILDYNLDFDFPDIIELTDKETGGHEVQYDLYPIPSAIRELVDGYRHEQSVGYLTTLERHHKNRINQHPNHVDIQDEWGKTALHRAVENGQFEAVKTLLLKGARDDIPNFWGRDVLETVKERHDDFWERLDDSEDNEYTCDIESAYRMEAGDALAAGKLPEFRRIGRYILRTRRFHKHVAPILRKAIELSGLNIDGDQFLRDLHLLSVEED